MILLEMTKVSYGFIQMPLQIFGHIKQNYKRTLAFDPRYPHVEEDRFVKHDWYKFYKGAVEPVPDNMPEPRGNLVMTHCFVDASHADNKSNQRSQMGILIFLN